MNPTPRAVVTGKRTPELWQSAAVAVQYGDFRPLEDGFLSLRPQETVLDALRRQREIDRAAVYHVKLVSF
jgi:hypothetical protein